MSHKRFHSFYKLDKTKRDSWRCPGCKVPKSASINTPVRLIASPETDHDGQVEGSVDTPVRSIASPETETEYDNQVGNITLRVKSAQGKDTDSSIE